jgi:hypothetical protein
MVTLCVLPLLPDLSSAAAFRGQPLSIRSACYIALAAPDAVERP